MTNSVKVTTKVEWLDDGSLSRLIPNRTVTVETTSDILSDNTQLVGTSHELIALGDVTDDALVRIENLHATAIVSVGHDVAASFVGLIDIPPGEVAILPRATTLATTYLDSDTASTPVRVTMFKIVAP
jgi:hypothetical protein